VKHLPSLESIQESIRRFEESEEADLREKLGVGPGIYYLIRKNSTTYPARLIFLDALNQEFPGSLPKAKQNSSEHSWIERHLENLGLEITAPALIAPPELRAEFRNRDLISDRFGGASQQGLVRFPGERIVNAFSEPKGGYADDEPSLQSPFGYRGQGPSGRQSLASPGNRLLESSRIERRPIRYWYRPAGGNFSFLTWAMVAGRVWVRGVGEDGAARVEINWQLLPIPDEHPENWSTDAIAALEFPVAPEAELSEMPEVASQPSYAELIERLPKAPGGPPRRTRVQIETQRSSVARRAALLRSSGKCEWPDCGGMPAETDKHGAPILQVDHIADLAKGGPDRPENMIALCPNCHAVKTLGGEPDRWRSRLSQIAREGHERMLRTNPREAPVNPASGNEGISTSGHSIRAE